MRHQTVKRKLGYLRTFCICLIFLTVLASCSPTVGTGSIDESGQVYPQTEVLFRATLLQPLPENTSLALEIVDDVTGLAFNPQRYEMTQQDSLNYFVKLPLTIDSVVKYRYIRVSDMNAIEYSPQGAAIRYRMAEITGPAIIQDNIAAWIDQPYNGVIGRVRGQFIDKSSKSPIANLLVTAEGVQTVTASDGTFTLEGLTLGTHNLVAYSMDGLYNTFQQGVVIAEEATTPVFLYIEKRQTVSVTFEVSTPTNFDSSIPIRFASNLQPLGNLYADLKSGSSTLASSLPKLTKVNDGKYQITLELPVGFDLRYKYTLGDGLWNSELADDGSIVLRELIVDKKVGTVTNTVKTFNSPNLQPVTFNVTTPQSTPLTDSVSIQLNPFGWFEPIPMVKVSDYQWTYTLYSPLHLLGQVEYRFCRNEMCELTSAIATDTQLFSPSSSPQSFLINIGQWSNVSGSTAIQITTNGGDISPRNTFLAGFELNSNYSPSANEYLGEGFSVIAGEAANMVVIPTTWTATRSNPPYLEPRPGYDYSWAELTETVALAKQQGLQVVLFPQLTFPKGAAEYWSTAQRDTGWWITWYENYHRYLMQVVDWANANSVDGIIVGDPSLAATFTGGKLADGSQSKAPDNADDQWRQLISDIRAEYSGAVIGAMAYPSSQGFEPSWLDSVDAIYVLYSPTLSQVSSISVDDLMRIVKKDLEESLYPQISKYGKTVILGVNYPSSVNAFIGCTDTLGSCMNDWSMVQVDLGVQSQIYNAAVIVAGKESWISGFISRNYQAVVSVQDSSASTHGKPAFDVLWFWYHYLLNIST